MNSVLAFWRDSLKADPIAHYAEMLGAVAVIIGSSILTYTVLEPRPEIFIPFYFVGSCASFFGAYRRGLPWVLILTGWFIIMNVIALSRLYIV
ncbi:MAG: hypothetical protein ACKVJK_06380 [Methylophagaceae bacterium]